MDTDTKAETKSVIGVGAIVIHSDGSILLGYRIKPGEEPTWCLPGGHVEPGESFEMAAIREVAEETGIDVLCEMRVLAIIQDLKGEISSVVGAVVTRLARDGVIPQVLESQIFSSWRWFFPHELPVPLFPASAAVLSVWLEQELPEGWKAYNFGKREGW